MRWCLPCHCRTAGCGTAASLRFIISVALPAFSTVLIESYYSAMSLTPATIYDEPR